MINNTADKLFTSIPSFEGVRGSVMDKTRGDKYIWGIVIILAITSVLVVYSATGSLAYKKNHGNVEVYLFKQLAFMISGMFIIYFLHRVNYTVFSKIAAILLVVSIPLLIYTLAFGAKINEGTRWIKVPIINLTIQTSDFAKIALFMYLSRVLSKKQDVIKDFKKGFLPAIIPVMFVCALIMPANLSNALLTGATSLLLMFIGRVSLKHIMLTICVAMVPIIFIISLAVMTNKPAAAADDENKNEVITDKFTGMGRLGTWVKRTQDFIYSSKNKKDPYQIEQAKMAIANGGILFGLGPGNSIARNYLPQAYNDFIFAVIIEEYGLIGGAFILFIYMIFLFRGIRIFRKCPYAFGAFLALALSFTLAIQAIANMAVNVNLLPVTGVTLPLISMGGSSFLFTCAAIGIILSVARNVEQAESKLPEPVIVVPKINTIPVNE